MFRRLTLAVALCVPVIVSAAESDTPVELAKRSERLAARLRPTADTARLDPLVAELVKLRTRLSDPAEDRDALTTQLGRVKREIAFCNPLLNFDKLLFIKRHDAGGVFHMCDQFYGFNAKPGGGLFVLHEPSGPKPRLVNLLQDAVVERGRLKGRRLEGGAFLSPELSYDGSTILFAWTEAKGKDLEWTPANSYHLFKVNADGTRLVQLTDGPWNDFDPCWLPDGRIAFISERRGGYLRCGRHCPVYTLFAMDADGQNIECLSFHETHEWQPSVDNNGMLVYTRWDYVDRDTNVAHHLWSCFPDGRDPRSYHGNYPQRRESRPWMEMHIRAVPGSPKYVAVAAAHHGHSFGSLVLVDPRREDDGAMSQLERLTPDVPFPEAETKKIAEQMIYTTPWPLSEDDYLCSYDPKAKRHGLYWIDRDGNRELIYADPEIASLDPIPLRPRPCPPLIPRQTSLVRHATDPAEVAALAPLSRTNTVGLLPDSLRAGEGLGVRVGSAANCAAIVTSDDETVSPRSTVAVMNIYDSDFAWPKDSRITSIRVIQALPKTTPPPNEPRIGVANQTNARAVLGTAPVEADGSAYLEVPAGKAIYFQALDADGMAVQSMRSATYVHAGERLVCQGCHEAKNRPPSPRGTAPLALQRAASRLEPESDGSNPFNYVRLVQPVLDRHCVDCHAKEKALDVSGALDGEFTRSYKNLAMKYGFYFHVGNGSIRDRAHGGSRSVAGQTGARAAPLLKYLAKSHHGVDLPPADLRRLTLWLDCNSEFLGAYENAAAQQKGEVVRPALD